MKWFLIFALAFACAAARKHSSSEEEGPFQCWDETELEDEQVCDGEEHCEHGEDEHVWACAEKNNQFVCHDFPDNTLIDNDRVCDGVADCPISEWAHSDIADDESAWECHDPDTEFPCDDETVIPIKQRCDGNNDCPEHTMWGDDGTTRDEDLWECKEEHEFVCWSDKKVIDESQLCDGNDDCSVPEWSDGNTAEDEILYHCPEDDTKFICWGGEEAIDKELMCNGADDCKPDEHLGIGSDENAYDCATEKEFACNATTVILKSKTCDGVADCATEDEDPDRCEFYREHNFTEIYCWSRREPLPIEKACDGHADCLSADEDEWTCPENSESGDNENAIARRNAARKDHEFNEFLQRRGINRRSLGMH